MAVGGARGWERFHMLGSQLMWRRVVFLSRTPAPGVGELVFAWTGGFLDSVPGGSTVFRGNLLFWAGPTPD